MRPRNSNWFDNKTDKDEVKTLGSTELSVLRSLIKDLLETIKYDDTGVTDDLADKAVAAAQILGIVATNPLDEEDGEEENYNYNRPRFDDED